MLTFIKKHKAVQNTIFILLTFVWFYVGTFHRPLFTPDEGRYVGVAWEMIRSGNWSTPTLNGFPYFHKPPLFYWITAASINLFGVHEFSDRVASVIGATIGIAAIYMFAYRWIGIKVARLFLLFAPVQPLIFAGSNYANLDMLVAGLMIASIMCLAHVVFLLQEGKPCRGALCFAYFLVGLTFLAKGLIAFVLPAIIVTIWLVLSKQIKLLPKLLSNYVAWAILIIVVAPWLIDQQIKYPGFLHYFIIVQHFSRFTGTTFNNVQPFWFYWAIILVLWSPFLYFVIKRLRYINQTTHSYFVGATRLLMWITALVIILFFSFPKSKLLGYMFPSVFPLVYLSVDALIWWLQEHIEKGKKHFIGKSYFFAIWFLSFLICLVAVIFVPKMKLKGQWYENKLGLFLRQQQSQEKIFFIEDYYFSIPYYARLKQPVYIVDNWDNSEVQKSDNWRKEIYDASVFSSDKQYLVDAQHFKKFKLEKGWVVADIEKINEYPQLLNQMPVFFLGKHAIWHIQ